MFVLNSLCFAFVLFSLVLSQPFCYYVLVWSNLEVDVVHVYMTL